MDKKTTPTHVVINQDYIQQLPTMKEPTYAGMPASKCPCIPLLDISYYEKAIKDFNDHVASLPKILRADEGKWEIGQQLREGVDFEISPRKWDGIGFRGEWFNTAAPIRFTPQQLAEQTLRRHYGNNVFMSEEALSALCEMYQAGAAAASPKADAESIEIWRNRAAYFEKEFHSANKEIIYLQEKLADIRKWIVEQRNIAHVNCLEDKKQAYNHVLAYMEQSQAPAPQAIPEKEEVEKIARQWYEKNKYRSDFPADSDYYSFIEGYKAASLRGKEEGELQPCCANSCDGFKCESGSVHLITSPVEQILEYMFQNRYNETNPVLYAHVASFIKGDDVASDNNSNQSK
jgi:hypothetical protein